MLVAGAGEGVHLATLPRADLREDVRGGAEAVEADAGRLAAHPQRAVADQPGAQQRRRLLIAVAGGEREAVALVRDRVLRVAAVDVPSRELRALGTGSRARCVQYRHSPSVHPSHGTPTRLPSSPTPAVLVPAPRRLDGADDLVAEDARWVADLHLSVEQVQVGAAYGARVHPQQQLSGTGPWDRALHLAQGSSDLLEDHRAHGSRRRRVRHQHAVKHALARTSPPSRSAEEQRGGLVQQGVQQLRLAQRLLERNLDDLCAAQRDHAPKRPPATASSAATPKRVASTRSNATGVPPRCTWPRIVTRLS